jgi:hypothetical protein
MASTRLDRTISSTGNRKILTFSAWIKRSKLGVWQNVASFGQGGNRDYIAFDSSDRFEVAQYAGGQTYQIKTTRVFRDTSAFYHIQYAIDTNQATASNRLKIYVNGVQETVFTNSSYPAEDLQMYYNLSGENQKIGSDTDNSNYFDGSMSHINYIDGTAYDASAFGETDTTTGEWIGKTSPSVTYGTNGFFILKDGNGITDQSGEGNDFTLGGGTLTDLKDNPDNTFATMNPLDKNTNVVLENGNTTSYSSADNTWVAANRATLGIAKDKFYWEMKITGSGTANGLFFGVCADTVALITSQGIQDNATERAKGILLFCDNGQSQLDTNSRVNMTSAPAFNDVLGCAVDRDNNTVKFYKNGSEVGSIDISSSPLATCSHIMPFMINYHTNTKFNFNFGNGYFGTTAVSSAGTNASNNGIFEYDVPTGYTALSTKGLNL